MKLHESTVLKNLSMFRTQRSHNGLMRDHESMYVLWKTVEYFCPHSLLEIGFYKGQTLGLMTEVLPADSKIVSVDKNYKYLDSFTNLFPKNSIQFIQSNSSSLTIRDFFDFIIIDGDHSYMGAFNDIQNCLPLLHHKSILVIDDYKYFNGVSQAVHELLLGQYGFIPFLCTEQQMLFHHVEHSAEIFLDQFLLQGAVEFMDFSNINWQDFSVLKAQIFITAIASDPEIFRSILKFYDL